MAKQTEETKAINGYIAELNRKYRQGYATEHTYRSALETLFKSLTTGLSITNEPKHIECGAPDYIVMRGDIPIGYIEAKDIGADLGCKASREQLDRYRRSLNNLIITDYIRFQLYADGELVTSTSVAKSNRSGIDADSSQFDAFLALLNRFAGYGGPTIRTSVSLSKAMAAKAKFLATVIEEALKSDDANKDTMNGNIPTIYGQLRGVRDVLISEISIKEFSDIYAQTVAYGMFAAKLNDNQASAFTRSTAATLITPSNPFLRNFFQYIAGFDLDERIRWVVDDLADLFNHVDIGAIIDEFGKAEHDPIIHFYETFLTEYDPVLRKSRGVWYTPRPVVQFIVRSVDEILKQEFKLPEGLADASKVKIKQKNDSGKEEEKEYHKVQILDPATGTGTFLAEIVKLIYSKYQTRQGEWQSYATEHLMPRISGFEILMASYTVAHIKLDMILRQTNYRHPANKRLRVYLTNSLEEAKTRTDVLFAQWLSDEANEASKVKRDAPLMVVIGNPPYSGESQNHGVRMGWIDALLDDYKKEPTGERLRERNSKWLNDDYVKFLRYGQYFVEKNAGGILAYITNHSFLDNPTFRGMRYNLLKTFDKIYILDLHGNAKKKEAAPDGSKDENVFNIKQGVSINIFVKTGRKAQGKLAEVFHCDLYGERERKFRFLQKNSLKSLNWRKLSLIEPQYFFMVKDFSHFDEYGQGFNVSDLFPVNSTGVVTSRDEFTIHHTAQAVKNTINEFIKLDTETARAKFNLGRDVRDWSVAGARSDLTLKPDFHKITQIYYRPFDTRYTYYTGNSRGFHCMPRGNVMQHFLNGENVGLIASRQCVGEWRHIFISNLITEFNLTGTAGRFGSGSVFPLYIYPKDSENENNNAFQNRRPNLKKAIVAEFAQKTGLRFTEEKEGGKTFAPIDVLDYIYAVLHSPAYRERYKEFLKIDFPRVPYPNDAKSFRHLVGIGAALRQLHLMIDVAPKKGLADFPIEGASVIETPRYADQKVYVNADQYFGHVPPEAWEFYVGGYQPAQKWLKDRIGQTLCIDDIWHYQKIIFVLCETAKIMKKLQNIED